MPAVVSCTAGAPRASSAAAAGTAPAAVRSCWCSGQSARLMSARAAWSSSSPCGSRSSSSSGGSAPPATSRRLSSGPLAACAARRAAARRRASGVPRESSVSSSGSASEPEKASLAGDEGGLGRGLPDPALGVPGGVTTGGPAAGGAMGGPAGATRPPSAIRAAAAARRSSVGSTRSLVERSDSTSTASLMPSGRGVKSTQTVVAPDGRALHHRLCATKVAVSASSKTTKPLMISQPRASCTASALPKLSSEASATCSTRAASSLVGTPISRTRVPLSCLPMKLLSSLFSLKLVGQLLGGDKSGPELASLDATTSEGSAG